MCWLWDVIGPREAHIWDSIEKGQDESETVCWEVRWREERSWGQSRKEGFLVEAGPSEEPGTIKWDGEEGERMVGCRETDAQQPRVHTSHLNHVPFFAGHFARCSQVLVCLHPVLTWIWSR